jgi:hypothetical protein
MDDLTIDAIVNGDRRGVDASGCECLAVHL